MQNACFRCKTPIESGETFCRDCSRTVDPAKLQRTPESRTWLGVAAFPVAVVVAVPLVALAELVLPEGAGLLVTSLVSLLVTVLAFVFLLALLYDARHLREREAVDWNPSEWLYYGLVAVTFLFLFLPAPFVAAYHLYRRYQTEGLPT